MQRSWLFALLTVVAYVMRAHAIPSPNACYHGFWIVITIAGALALFLTVAAATPDSTDLDDPEACQLIGLWFCTGTALVLLSLLAMTAFALSVRYDALGRCFFH